MPYCFMSFLLAVHLKGDVDITSLDMPVHVVATAVKNFFSCLSEPLIPTDLHQDILDCLTGSEVRLTEQHSRDSIVSLIYGCA